MERWAAASYVEGDIYGIPTEKAEEFTAVGVGGLSLSGQDRAVVSPTVRSILLISPPEASFTICAYFRVPQSRENRSYDLKSTCWTVPTCPLSFKYTPVRRTRAPVLPWELARSNDFRPERLQRLPRAGPKRRRQNQRRLGALRRPYRRRLRRIVPVRPGRQRLD